MTTITKERALKLHPLAPAVLEALDNNHDDTIATLLDVSTHGPDRGFGGFGYYSETVAFAQKHRKLIAAALMKEFQAIPRKMKDDTYSDVLFSKPYMRPYHRVPSDSDPDRVWGDDEIPADIIRQCLTSDSYEMQDPKVDNQCAFLNGMAWYALDVVAHAIANADAIEKEMSLVSDDVVSILRQCRVEGNLLYLPDVQLERKSYEAVKKWLEHLGGRWTSGTKAFKFVEDPSTILQLSLDKGNIKKEDQFFATPDDVADMMMAQLRAKDMHYGMAILEPSAGRGALINALRRTWNYLLDDMWVIAVEQNHINAEFLKKIKNIRLIEDDFLKVDFSKMPECDKFDLIIANPPFTKNADIAHIKRMYEILRPKGTLVTLASPHWETSSNKKETEFRAWLVKVGAKITTIDAGKFASSGTGIETRMLVIRK